MKAYELLDSPERWTQFVPARNSAGEVVKAKAPDAVCWCIMGAIVRCYPKGKRNMFEDFCNKVRCDLSQWNDRPERTWEEVYNLLKEYDI